eukprot:Nk52_evm17s1869 gene=Nk52_evmTU17s1869
MVCSAAENVAASEQVATQTLSEKIYSYPVVSAAYEKSAELYNNAKEAYPTVKVALEKAEEAASAVAESATPLVTPVLEKANEKIDFQYYNDATVGKLNELEGSYPIMKETPENILSSGKAYVSETVEGGKQYIASSVEASKNKVNETTEAVKSKVAEVTQTAQCKVQEQNEALKASLEKVQEMIKVNFAETQAKAAEGAQVVKENVNMTKAAEATKQLAENIKESVMSAKDSATPELEAKYALLMERLNEFYAKVSAEESEEDESYVKHARTLMALGKESLQVLESAKVTLSQYTNEVMSKIH